MHSSTNQAHYQEIERELFVAGVPHSTSPDEGGGFFLSSDGNDMAKCQRTKLDTARSLHKTCLTTRQCYTSSNV
ncbi:hypothetical protein PSAC2689_30212 [Paraburkholderia sacchari]